MGKRCSNGCIGPKNTGTGFQFMLFPYGATTRYPPHVWEEVKTMASNKKKKPSKNGKDMLQPIAFEIECAYDPNNNKLMCKLGDVIQLVGDNSKDQIDDADPDDASRIDDDQSDEIVEDPVDDDETQESADEPESAPDEDRNHGRKSKDKHCSVKKGTMSCIAKTLQR